MIIYRDFTFDAAHVLEGYDKTHPYGRVHGHSFRARVWVKGEPEPENSMILDLGYIAKECEFVKNLLDHNTLNNVDGLYNPTLEGLCVFIWNKLIINISNLNKIEVHRDQSGEGCVYYGPENNE
jgi:6-pyruvoyltetrahydropterin/6-carboxytetrahydropterin synthase